MINDSLNSKMQEIIANPHKFGAPTFEEFARDKDKYLGREDDILKTAFEGAHILKKSNLVRKHIYKIFGYTAKSEDHVWQIMKNEGYSPLDFEIKPELTKAGNGQYDVIVDFTLKNKGGIRGL